MLLRHAIGSVLRRIRTEQGTTLRELSEHSRVSVPYLSEIERGRKEPSSEMIAAVAGALEVTLIELTAAVVDDLRSRSGERAVVGVRAAYSLAA